MAFGRKRGTYPAGSSDRYEELQVGTPQPFPATAYQVNGICHGCRAVLHGTGLTEGHAVQNLKKHYRAHIGANHRKAPGQENWIQAPVEDDPVEYTKQVHAGNPAVMALMAEVERGRARRDKKPRFIVAHETQRLARETKAGEPESAGYGWCIGCQQMVPIAAWPEHQPHHPLQMPRSTPGP